MGEIQDERDTDEVAPIQVVADDQLRVEGGVALSELEGVLGHSFDREDVSTVGGLVLAEFGRVPRAGETIDLHGYRLVVEQVVRRRVRRVVGVPAGGRGSARRRGAGGSMIWLAIAGRSRRRRVRRHRGRRAHHGEPGGADPRREPQAARRGAVARLAFPGGLLSDRGVGHDLAGRAARGSGASRPRGLGRAAASSCCSRILGVPLVLFAAYLVPRWLTQPRAETVADRVIPAAPALVANRRSAPARPECHAPHRPPVDLAGGRRGRPPRRRRAAFWWAASWPSACGRCARS